MKGQCRGDLCKHPGQKYFVEIHCGVLKCKCKEDYKDFSVARRYISYLFCLRQLNLHWAFVTQHLTNHPIVLKEAVLLIINGLGVSCQTKSIFQCSPAADPSLVSADGQIVTVRQPYHIFIRNRQGIHILYLNGFSSI